VPTLFLHQQIDPLREEISENFSLPNWVWIAIAAALVFLITRIHETAVHLVDRHFNRAVSQAGERLGNAILTAKDFAEIEGHLVHGAHSALGLASASVFREQGGIFRRSARMNKSRDWSKTMRPRGQSSYSYDRTMARRARSTVLSRRHCAHVS
jgi:hypothetical protein